MNQRGGISKEEAIKFGNMIFAARKRLGYSQGYIAEKIGVSQKSIAFWEAGERNPKEREKTALLKILELEPISTNVPHGTLQEGREEYKAAAPLPEGRSAAEQTLLNLSESHKALAFSHERLTITHEELVKALQVIAGAAKKSPAVAAAIPADFLELIADVAMGKKYGSKTEVLSILHKFAFVQPGTE